MHKPRYHWHLDQALFVLLIMVGAVVSTVLDVQAIAAAMAAGRSGLGAGTAAVGPLPVPPPASGGASSKRADTTIVARISR